MTEKNNRSLSKLVEDYFRNLVSEIAPRQNDYPPLVKKLTGVISERDLEKLSRKEGRVKHILGQER
jgi:hypothetical protein